MTSSLLPDSKGLPGAVNGSVSETLSRYFHASDFEVRVLLFVGYFLAAYSTLELQHLNGPAASFWAPTGIAIAAFMVRGRSIWPIVFCAAFLADALSFGSLLGGIAIATGQTLEGWIGAYLAGELSDHKVIFLRPSSVLRFVLLAAPVAATVSATIGVIACYQIGYVSRSSFGSVWLTWWQGDVVGAIVVTPLVVLLAVDLRHAIDIAKSLSLLAILLSLIFVCIVVFCPTILFDGNGHKFLILIVPLLIWTAVRYCPMETAITNAIVAGFVFWNSIHNSGPFAQDLVPTYMAGAFIAVICITNLVLSAVFAEKRVDDENRLISSLILKEATHTEIRGLNNEIEALRLLASTQCAMRKLVGNTESALQELLVSVPDAIRITDFADQKVLYVSRAFECIFGRSCDEMCREPQSWLSNVHSEDQARVARFLRMDLQGPLPESFEIEYRVLRPNGSIRRVLDRGIFVRDGLGKIARLVGMASDVTDIKTSLS